MITQDLGMAHPWLAALAILLAVSWVTALPHFLLAKATFDSLLSKMLFTNGLIAGLLACAAFGHWAARPSYTYLQCDTQPQCQDVVVGKIYTR